MPRKNPTAYSAPGKTQNSARAASWYANHLTTSLRCCADIASEILVVDAISQHWQHIFPGKMLVVPYEKIVMDLEGTARDMLSHCGLPWDDRVLHFHENLRTVQTASLAQVHYQ